MTTRQRQNLLQYLGYYQGPVDGIWGEQSRRATEAFQRDFQLTVNGIFEDATQRRLLEAIASGEQMKESDLPASANWWAEIKYFTRDEAYIGCPCGRCGGFPAEPTEKLMRAADAVREHFGAPMIPTSTVRCRAHNSAVGGVWNSRHMEGRAMDFYVKGHSGAEVLAFVRTLNPSYAYIIGGDTVHMDF